MGELMTQHDVPSPLYALFLLYVLTLPPFLNLITYALS